MIDALVELVDALPNGGDWYRPRAREDFLRVARDLRARGVELETIAQMLRALYEAGRDEFLWITRPVG